MPPIQLNRRRFIGGAAAAGWAISQGRVEGAAAGGPVRLGLIGLGTRGTALLRLAIDAPGAEVVALCDAEPKHRARAGAIVEKAGGRKVDLIESADRLLDRPEVDAVIVALPCDLHASTYENALRAGKHLYAEKPLGLSVAECDRVIAEAAARPDRAVHVGYQRRSNARYRDAIAAIHRGDLGELLSGSSTWVSSNGPIDGHGGWLARRERSGDWMVEQAVHVWDVFQWAKRSAPARAFGAGRKRVFGRSRPDRDVTDDYQVQLVWDDGFAVSFVQSWAAPADDGFTGHSLKILGTDGGFDFATGSLTFRDRKGPRQSIHPGPQADTAAALNAFLDSVRSPERAEPAASLIDSREATITGLMARMAVDEGRVVARSEILGASSS